MNEREYWNGLKKFTEPVDVPKLPIPLTDFHVRRLKELGAMAKGQLVTDQWYIGDHRCVTVARWDGSRFTYIKQEFNFRFFEECNHFEDDDGYSLFVPLRIAKPSEIPQELPENGK